MAESRVAHTEMALHTRRPGWPGVVSRIQRWRYTRGGQDGLESCRAYRDGAIYAETMDICESWHESSGYFFRKSSSLGTTLMLTS